MGKLLKKLKTTIKEIKKPNSVKQVKNAFVTVNNDFKKQIIFTKALIKNQKQILTAAAKAACSGAKEASRSLSVKPAP